MWNDEQTTRQEILSMVRQYHDKYHKKEKQFEEGEKSSYASKVYDSIGQQGIYGSRIGL